MRRLLAPVLLVLGSGALGAQVVDPVRPDTLPRDTTDYTALFLRSQQESRRLVPALPRVGERTLLPPGSRIVFDRDSITWSGAETVSDLLTRVPGVFLWRGGWIGRAELPNYQAHGPASVEYLVDGIPYLPIGGDSVAVDPSLFPLSLIHRVEVERLPGQLRVWLFTYRNDRVAPYSRIGIASGDLRIERYQGELEKRSGSGPGLALAFDHLGVPAQTGTIQSNPAGYSNTQGIVRLSYVRSPRAGVEAQFWQSTPNRQAVVVGAAGDTASRALHGRRRDLTARLYYGSAGSTGFYGSLLLGRTLWLDEIRKDSTLELTEVRDENGVVTRVDSVWTLDKYRRSVNQAGLVLGFRGAAAEISGSALVRSEWTPFELRVRTGVAPVRFLSLSLEGTLQRHEAERSSRWLVARAGLELPLGFSANGSWSYGDRVHHPALVTDTARRMENRSVGLAWRSGIADLEGTFSTNLPFAPLAYREFPGIALIGPSALLSRTDWVAVGGRISPRQWISVSGWYSHPASYAPEGQPPRHAMAAATIQSKFLPTFRSGIFNLKIQVSMERWGAGVLGQSADSLPIALPAVTYYRGFIGLQLGSFMAYYDRYNMQGNQNVAHVPGLVVPGYASTFAVRWEFRN